MSETIEPPESDELFDQEKFVESAITRAKDYHNMMDGAKQWAITTAADLRVEAALEDDEETADEINQAAELVMTIPRRIEQGDITRTRQP